MLPSGHVSHHHRLATLVGDVEARGRGATGKGDDELSARRVANTHALIHGSELAVVVEAPGAHSARGEPCNRVVAPGGHADDGHVGVRTAGGQPVRMVRLNGLEGTRARGATELPRVGRAKGVERV